MERSNASACFSRDLLLQIIFWNFKIGVFRAAFFFFIKKFLRKTPIRGDWAWNLDKFLWIAKKNLAWWGPRAKRKNGNKNAFALIKIFLEFFSDRKNFKKFKSPTLCRISNFLTKTFSLFGQVSKNYSCAVTPAHAFLAFYWSK